MIAGFRIFQKFASSNRRVVANFSAQFILLLFFVSTVSSAKAQNESSESDYLKSNMSLYNEKTGIMAGDEYSKYRFFVTGEFHFRQENSKIFLKVFRELYYKANVRLILFEAGYAYGLIAQHYLETGDKKSLEMIASEGQFSDIHYRHLKEFYDKLPEDEKFSITGIDLDNYSGGDIFIYAAELIFRDTIMPEEFRNLLDDYDEVYKSESYDVYRESFNPIFLNVSRNEELYSSLLGDRYQQLDELVSRMRSSFKFDFYNYNTGQDSVQQTKRETYIYRNAVKEINKNPNVNYFGQFGLAHIGLSRFMILDKSSGVQSFTAKLHLTENSPVKDSVCSIAILYFDDYDSDFSKVSYYYSEWTYTAALKNILPPKVYKTIKRHAESDKLYFIDLAKKSSPFNEFAQKNFQYLIFKR
jgi:hypothetical protein